MWGAALFVLMLFRFRIILVAYHLRHQCVALLPVDHFSTDLLAFELHGATIFYRVSLHSQRPKRSPVPVKETGTGLC